MVMNFLDIFFPKRCVGCGRLGKYFCEQCSLNIRIIKPNEAVCPVCEKPGVDGATHPRCRTRYALDGLTSFFRYDAAVRQAIKSIKYRYISDLPKEFIDLIPVVYLHSSIINHKSLILIPIPLHPARLKFRGFNQAEVLGKLLAQRLNIPVRIDLLQRVKKTTPQVDMKDRKRRLANMEGVFSVTPNLLISNSLSFFLFDDVFTTGATMRSAANVLKRAGVKFVWGITMAR